MNLFAKQTGIEIVGHYTCEGGDYRGEVAIRRLGDAFAVHWTISGSVQVGVGVRSEQALAVCCALPSSGAVLYEIRPEPKLLGRFCGFPSIGEVREEVLTFSHGLREWEVGAELLANWSRDPFWYPAEVLDKRSDGQYHVRFADGDEEWTDASRMVGEYLTVGDMVFYTGGLFHRDENGNRVILSMDPNQIDQSRLSAPCRIIAREGHDIRLEYQDGVRIKTTVDNIRTLAPREQS